MMLQHETLLYSIHVYCLGTVQFKFAASVVELVAISCQLGPWEIIKRRWIVAIKAADKNGASYIVNPIDKNGLIRAHMDIYLGLLYLCS